MRRPIERAAPAKLNLYLHVVGCRADGYHELDSLVVFPECADRLAFEPADRLVLSVSGPRADEVPKGEDNLVLRAAHALAKACGVGAGAHIALEKQLPAAGGIGGGSADAAATLLGLCDLWGLATPPAKLAEIGLALGADVPVCLSGRPTRLRGIGERLTVAPALPAFWVVLANPGRPLPTRDVFQARQGAFSPPAELPERFADLDALIDFLRGTRNDLGPAATRLAPEVGDLLGRLGALTGARLARMSGSGATCYALFPTVEAAQAGLSQLGLDPGWWAIASGVSRPR